MVQASASLTQSIRTKKVTLSLYNTETEVHITIIITQDVYNYFGYCKAI